MHHPEDIIVANQNTGLSVSPLAWFLIGIGAGVVIVRYLVKKRK